MNAAAPAGPERRRIRVEGVVQGVGFRPWVHGRAVGLGLAGYVLNDEQGVLIDAEGPRPALDVLVGALRADAPGRVEEVRSAVVPVAGLAGFAIAPSRGTGAHGIPVGPDVATCDDCLRELRDPADRRHGYAFIACSRCGPRFTVVERLPYDRARTTMRDFPMCAACRAEYEDPADRRFHAEATGCPACGPRLSMTVEDAVAVLRGGRILAVKGIGGWHLACDAGHEAAVTRLRQRKRRDAKPFAVMTHDPEALVAGWADHAAEPIVVLPRRADASVAPSVAPGNPWLGVLRPYTPVHHLLLDAFGGPLVMTSGNRSDEPIATGETEARVRLGEIADAFLGHDRRIARRCEDTVLRGAQVVRRSRGLAPDSLPLPVPAGRVVVAAGAELKSTFCVARGGRAFLSAHLGDLDGTAAREAFREDLRLYLEMLGVRPEVVAHDLHPDYASTRWALEQDAELVGVQHHHAHAAACLAEHGETSTALAIVLDGTGYGTDGTLWGGELLRCDLRDFERVDHLDPVPLPGGAAAIREPWRVAAAYLEAADRPVRWERWPLVRQSLGVNAPLSSGAGRLLDAVAALLGVRDEVSYEGQAAIELEHLAGRIEAAPYPVRGLRGADLIRAAHDDLDAGRNRGEIAAAVHEGLAAALAQACAGAGDELVVLSGGCLQNTRLATSLRRRLEAEGRRVLLHRRVPANDGGISYGQAVVAAARMN